MTARRPEPERDEARLAWLEAKAVAADRRGELRRYQSGEAFPLMDPDKRAAEIVKLESEVREFTARTRRFKRVVGDPETVVAVGGTIPSERRATNRVAYIDWRHCEIARLEAEAAEHQTIADDKSRDRADRNRARTRLSTVEGRLRWLAKLPSDDRLRADAVCPDGIHLMSEHGYRFTFNDPKSPCSAWPGWKARMQKVAAILVQAELDRRRQEEHGASTTQPTEKPAVNPTVLASFSKGTSAREVNTKLAELLGEHPDAVIRTKSGRIEVVNDPPT